MKTKQYILFLIYLTAVRGQDGCHCLNKTACPNCNSQCDPDWSGPSCHKYNIARNRPAYQNSEGELCSTFCSLQPASLAVDGDTSTDRNTRCSRTAENGATATLTVPFDHPKLIDRIGLYFSNEGTDRGDFQVWIDDKSCYNRSLTDPVTSHIEIACVQQMVGKQVTVTLPPVTITYRVLALCEMEIYECEKQWSGENCDIFCSSCTGDTSLCDQRNQQCYNRDVNIAYGETALFIPDPQFLFNTADSVINGNTNDDNCAAVGASTPWWEIQFGKTRTISRIKIFWSNADIPSSFTISVDDILCYHQVSLPPPPRVFIFSCPSPIRGDRVRIQRQSTEKEQLILCEVEIFECTDQFYGPDCKHRCNCQGNEYCDKVNGTCFSQITTVTTTPVTTQSSSSHSTTSSLSTRTTSSSTRTTSSSTITTSSSTTTTPPSTEPTEESLNSMTKTAWSSTSTTEKQETSDVKINQSGGVKVFDLIESRFPASIQGDPSVTTDGNTSLASCVIINGTQPSWKVTFDKQYIIDGLKLYIPLSAELTKFSVQIEGTFCYQRSSSVPIVTPYRFQCFDKLTGDSVTIFVPQAESMVSLSLCEVDIYGESAKTTESTDGNPSDDIPIPAVVVPCVIAVIIGVVIVIIVVLRHRGYSCVKSKEDINEPHYAGLDRKPEDYYSTLTPPTYQNEPGPNTYENEQIQLEERNT